LPCRAPEQHSVDVGGNPAPPSGGNPAAVDIWALGYIIWHMFTGRPPFANMSDGHTVILAWHTAGYSYHVSKRVTPY
jgi:serine/threonine protein kinase